MTKQTGNVTSTAGRRTDDGQNRAVIADEVAGAFGIGEATGALAEAARGWGGHNVVYRLETTLGQWALKDQARELDDLSEERFEIEMGAFGGGVRMPRPVPTIDGDLYAVVAGRRLRCHEWADGIAKTNEETTCEESRVMGGVVAHLHRLALAWSERLDHHDTVADGPSWAQLAEAATRRGSSWADTLAEHLPTLERLAARAHEMRRQHPGMTRVGSHGDLNAHNVLFTGAGLSLIDWDGAGPMAPSWERAKYATLWSSRHGGRYDIEAAVAFLGGYRDAGGEVSADDPDTLVLFLDNHEGWAKQNVRWALDGLTPEQDYYAGLLIDALLGTPAVIEERRRLLQAAISRLASVSS
jgi:Ser/Thr protein kinase RdoA (MazF antagonist)